MTDKSQSPAVLNLDELFGQGTYVTVLLAGAEHKLLRPEAMGPKELVTLMKRRTAIAKLQSQLQDPSQTDDAEQAEQLMTLMDELLNALCPTLPIDDLTFGQKSAILTFYSEHTSPKNSTGAAPPTGETPSR